MDNLTIRKAKIEDLDLLLGFEQEVIMAESPYDPTIRNERVHYYNLQEMIDSDDALLVVAELDSQIVASGYALKKRARHYLDHEFYAYLGFMFTHPDFRRRGINNKLIDELKNWAFSKGLTEIRLTVYDKNIPAIRAYEKIGFKKHIIEMRLVDSKME